MAKSSPPGRQVVSALLLGIASGLRSQIAWASILARLDPARLPARLRSPWLRRFAVTASLAELIVDKLPKTPPRTAPLPLAARIGFGAVSATTGAKSVGGPAGTAAFIGATGAVLGAFSGRALRQRASVRVQHRGGLIATRHLRDGRFGQVEVALVEDLVAIAIALAGTRLVARPPTELPPGLE